MNAKTKTNLLSAFIMGAALSIVAGGAAVVQNAKVVKAENAVAPVMTYGASVRYASVSGTNGLRFQATVAKEDYNENATYGMLILPEDYVKVYPLTVENVFGESAVYDWATQNENEEWVYTGAKKRIINISYSSLASNAAGDYVINGSILNIKDKNVSRNFVGCAYSCLNGTYALAQWASADGETADIANNTRSMLYVAQAAIKSGAISNEQKDLLKTMYIDKCYATACDTSDYIATDNTKVTLREEYTDSELPEGCDKAYHLQAGYGANYALFGNIDTADYIRLKFWVKGVDDTNYICINGWGNKANTPEWYTVVFEKQSDGKWTLYFNNSTKADIENPYVNLCGNFYVTALYGVADPEIPGHTVIYKDELGNILATESVRTGEKAAYASLLPANETLADGSTKVYSSVNWYISGGDSAETALQSVTGDLTVYRSSKSYIYKTFNKVYLTNVMSSLPYITADENGDITFRIRLNRVMSLKVTQFKSWSAEVDNWPAFWVYANDLGSWYTVKTDKANGKIYVLKPDGSTEKVYDIEVKVEEITLCTGDVGDLDIATAEN